MEKIVNLPLWYILVGVHAFDDLIPHFLPNISPFKYVLQDCGPWISVVVMFGHATSIMLEHTTSSAS